MASNMAFLVGAFASGALAFPTMNWDNVQARQTDGNQGGPDIPCTPIQPAFDAKSQYVSTSGQYAWVAPGPSDARGPCPGLNAAANHGYLPHNGVASITDLIQGTYAAFGMAQDLSGFLAVYGAIFDGNLEGYSIGGPSASEPVIGGGQLGTGLGLAGSHNNYENDASPIRGDLYTYGNDYENQVSLFQQFIDLETAPDDVVNYGLNDIAAFRVARFQNSIDQNPYFWNGPFSGFIASPAAYTFIYRFMANKSAEFPEGRLNRAILQDFYSMSGESGSYKYTPGYERIPETWYKRNPADDYSIPYFICDTFNQIKDHPQFADLGGNLGKTNTFTGIDPTNLTGGVYNTQQFATDPHAAACFAFEFTAQAGPNLLEGLVADVTPANSALADAISKAATAGGFTCDPIETLQYSQFGLYPGYAQAYKGYTPPSFLSKILK